MSLVRGAMKRVWTRSMQAEKTHSSRRLALRWNREVAPGKGGLCEKLFAVQGRQLSALRQRLGDARDALAHGVGG